MALVAAALFAVGAYGYQVGVGLHAENRRVTEAETARLAREVSMLSPANAALEERVRRLEAALQEEQARYRRDAPNDTEAPILRNARARIEAGVSVERLAAILAAAPVAERCEPAMETRRFALATADFPNMGGVGRFASGGIVVTGSGRSARDEGGRLQAWYDPTAPISLKFARPGGQTTEVSGSLPLFHTVVIAEHAWRFSIAPGTRSLVEISADRCAYP